MKTFALIGAAGYIAPRHFKAIKETGNGLVAAFDKFDSVGILDSYFPNTHFFTEFERFDRHVDKLRRTGNQVDFVSICSPNYLHDAHIRFGLRNLSNVICEKPLVLSPWNIDTLLEMEKEYNKKVYTILQLRLHPTIIALKEKIEADKSGRKYDVDLTYITSRGSWYYTSWKGDISKSGGIATNIGVHFFDMLSWIFGKTKHSIVHLHQPTTAAGYLELEKANVRWFLSTDYNTLPPDVKSTGKRTFRSITLEGEEIEFSEGFTDLHTKSYEQIMNGSGFGMAEAYPSIELVHQIRNAEISPLAGDYHPKLKA